jgi:hypothetical protein
VALGAGELAHLGLEAIQLVDGVIRGVYSQFVALGCATPLSVVNLLAVQRPSLALGRLPANTRVGETTSAGRLGEVEVYLVEGLPVAEEC